MHLQMLPHALICLLLSWLVQAQTSQPLPLGSVSAFNGSATPSLFRIPSSADTLSISVALCATSTSPPQFFFTNNSAVSDPGPEGGTDVFPILLRNGIGNWTGSAIGGGVLSVQNAAGTSFEVAVSNSGQYHEILSTPPYFGDSTSNQAILLSAPFDPPDIVQPRYPNYTLPSANITQPSPPSNASNYTIILAPTNTSPQLTSLPQTGCALRAASGLDGHVVQQNLWLRDSSGWRMQWFMDQLTPQTNYTAYVIQDQTKVSGPLYFATKSALFACPLVHSLPYCPGVNWAVPLAEPPDSSPAYDNTSLPISISSTLVESLTNFTTVLTTFACGRDVYSPLQSCADCQTAYRQWLCNVWFPRCTEENPSAAVAASASSTSTSAIATGTAQAVLSALSPQPSNATQRNAVLPPFNASYTALLPCLETCMAVDRACPYFLGFKCPLAFNVNASYGVGYVDSVDSGVEGDGLTGVTQDQWGNVWCNA